MTSKYYYERTDIIFIHDVIVFSFSLFCCPTSFFTYYRLTCFSILFNLCFCTRRKKRYETSVPLLTTPYCAVGNRSFLDIRLSQLPQLFFPQRQRLRGKNIIIIYFLIIKKDNFFIKEFKVKVDQVTNSFLFFSLLNFLVELISQNQHDY